MITEQELQKLLALPLVERLRLARLLIDSVIAAIEAQTTDSTKPDNPVADAQ